MADLITFTPTPITLFIPASTRTFWQPLWEAIDVSQYDILDLMCGVFYLTSGWSVTPIIGTSMQRQSGQETTQYGYTGGSTGTADNPG